MTGLKQKQLSIFISSLRKRTGTCSVLVAFVANLLLSVADPGRYPCLQSFAHDANNDFQEKECRALLFPADCSAFRMWQTNAAAESERIAGKARRAEQRYP
jgi:hypothetical protein